MIKRGFRLIAAVVAFAYAYSCADNATMENEYDYYESFDLWAKENYPNLAKADDVEGIYWKFTKNGIGNVAKPNDTTYVSIKYTAKKIDGSYIVNTYNDSLARQFGQFYYQTRYDAPFTYRMDYYYGYYGITYAHYLALTNMSVGDKVEMLVAPTYGYNASGSTYLGYAGSSYISSATSIIEMELVSMTDYPDIKAEDEVTNYAIKNELTTNVEDGAIYMKWITRSEDLADTLHRDSAVTYYYTGEFPDGLVFDTNVLEVAEENNIYNSSLTYTPSSFYYIPDDSTDVNSTIPAFQHVIEKMRIGDKVQFVTSPDYAYGSGGSYSTEGTYHMIYWILK